MGLEAKQRLPPHRRRRRMRLIGFAQLLSRVISFSQKRASAAIAVKVSYGPNWRHDANMKEGPTKRDGPADAPSTGAVDAPDGGQRGAGANWRLATADAYAQLPGPPSSHQPVHAVSNGENRKTGARNRSGGSPHLAGRVGTIPVAVASRCRWHGHRQRQRKCCCGKNAPGYLHGCFPLRPPRRRYLNIFKNYISVTN